MVYALFTGSRHYVILPAKQKIQKSLKKLQRSGKNTKLTINDVWVDQYYGSYCPGYLFPTDLYDIADFLRTGYLDPRNHTVAAVKTGVKGMDYSTEPQDVIINTPGSGWPSVIRYYDKSSILLWEKECLYDIEKEDYYLGHSIVASWDYRKIINHAGKEYLR
ncbi:MAG: hypothetical protein LBH20_04820 [Treponema sp.]|nr:hypothetical protein [Treponema sp.]